MYLEQIDIMKAQPLLQKCGLSVPAGVNYTAGLFDDNGLLIACGSLKYLDFRNSVMIQGIAVDPDRQGEDLLGKLMTHLVEIASEKYYLELFLFTKPEKVVQFENIGFRLVASARPYAALMEWGGGKLGIDWYLDRRRSIAKRARSDYYHRMTGGKSYGPEIDPDADKPKIARLLAKVPYPEKVSALVMNCNPFTLGHRWLIEQAAAESDLVYVFVVDEDASLFDSAERYVMVKNGVADLENVTVMKGGIYVISSLTFPSYFTKEENLAKAHTAIDAEIFGRHIAPAMEIKRRYIGTEPISAVTAVYNETLKERLPRAGIEVVELPRLELDGQVVSASRVRALLGDSRKPLDNPTPELIAELAKLVPETTLKYLLEEVPKYGRTSDEY